MLWQNVEGCGWQHSFFRTLIQTVVFGGGLLRSLEIFLDMCFVTNAVFSFCVLDLN